VSRLAALVATVALAAGAIVVLVPQPHTPAAHGRGIASAESAEAIEPCVWDDELHRTLDELGEDPADWRLARSPDYWGKVFPDGTVVVNPDVPCDSVSSVVRHEWMHLQQLDMYGADLGSMALGRNRVEIVADCGSMLLGSTNTPYVRDQLDAHGVGCTDADLADARELIEFGPHPG
jgi:hypothetical protein